MTTEFRWKRDADFSTELRTGSDDRVRAIHDWAIAGEDRASSNGRHNSPSARRAWRARRLEAAEELARRDLLR
jgi:hypothetical protein